MLNCILGSEFCHANEEKQLAFQFPHANRVGIVETENMFCHLSGSRKDKALLKKKFYNLSAGSLLNTQNKCLYSIRGTLSRSGGSKMDQFSVIHNRLKNLLFFFPPKQTRLFCFRCLRKKRKTGKLPALVYRTQIINSNAWPVAQPSCAVYNNRVAQPGAFGFSRTFIKRCWRTRRLPSRKQALAHKC